MGVFINVQTRCHGENALPFFGYEAPCREKASSRVWMIHIGAEYRTALF